MESIRSGDDETITNLLRQGWLGVIDMGLLLKIVGSGILLVLSFFAYLIWSEETVIYRCEGEGRYSQSFIDEYGKRENPYVAEIGFLKIESYSKLTLLYNEDSHTIWWERPDGILDLWTNVSDLGVQLQLKNYDGEVEGVFSTVSKSLSFSKGREFKGLCRAVSN